MNHSDIQEYEEHIKRIKAETEEQKKWSIQQAQMQKKWTGSGGIIPGPLSGPLYYGVGSSPIEDMIEAPFLVLWYSSVTKRYSKQWCHSDEEAVEATQKLMTDPGCQSVEIFELAHRWKREWRREEKR